MGFSSMNDKVLLLELDGAGDIVPTGAVRHYSEQTQLAVHHSRGRVRNDHLHARTGRIPSAPFTTKQ